MRHRIVQWIVGASKTAYRAAGRVAKLPVVRRWWREVAVFSAIILTLWAPFALRPAVGSAPASFDRRLVILTPHNDKIRREFGIAFSRHWKKKTGEDLYVDWRVGGTSEIALTMRSDFAGAFEQYWSRTLGRQWTSSTAGAFSSPKVTVPPADAKAGLSLEQQARKAFMDSSVGIGVDLFFGGGAFDFLAQSKAGFLVSADPSGRYGLGPLAASHPDWFQDGVIPASLSGEPCYDREKRWVGTCFSSLGICYNRDVLQRLGIEAEPQQWEDLSDSRYFGQIALSDPNKSGTVTKAFEQLIQQQMQIAISSQTKQAQDFRTDEEVLAAGISAGWERGLRLIQRISANARYFTDNATKIPWEVAQGDAAAGMCIDFYGRSFEEQVRESDGTTRMAFVTPIGGSSIGVDPVGMLRGAPEPMVASAFMEFVLSEEGQRLWNFKAGTPGGPVRDNLRRLPVRLDFYTEENRVKMTDPSVRPFEEGKAFTYHPERTEHLFGVIRFLVKTMCVETHEEQREAWRVLVANRFPKRATEVFGDTRLINYQAAQELAVLLSKKDKVLEARKSRELSTAFRNQYRRAAEMALDGF